MISNYISLVFCFFELFVFTGIAYGYSFLQFIFVDELVLWDEYCSTDETINDTKVICDSVMEFHSMIFTSGIISSSIGIVVFGLLELKYGQFVVRLTCNIFTTVGLLLLSLYRLNGYLIIIGWTLMSTPAVYYITSNCNLASFFPRASGILVVMISAVFDMSTGLFLLFKLAYQNFNIDLPMMLQSLTGLSLLLWIRTFCLMPYYRSNPKQSVYRQSLVGQYRNKLVEQTINQINNTWFKINSLEKPSLWSELKPAIKSVNLWQFMVYYTLISCRIKSVQGWIYPWLDWAFSNTADNSTVSEQLNVYGYTYFMSPVIALLPGLISLFVLRLKKDQFIANLYQVVTLIIATSILSAVISFQMGLKLADQANSIALIVLFSVDKIWLYAAPPAFCITFFPVHMISSVYGLLTIPGIIVNWLITALFGLILKADDFGPVSFAFGGACLLCLGSGILTLVYGRRVKNEKSTKKTWKTYMSGIFTLAFPLGVFDENDMKSSIDKV